MPGIAPGTIDHPVEKKVSTIKAERRFDGQEGDEVFAAELLRGFQCFITDQQDEDIAALEATHRQHAQVEDRVKTLKATGASYLPFHSFAANAAWFELALAAHDVIVWTQLLTLDGEHRLCEPKRLRYRILHVAGQLTRHARRTTLHLPADWPWAGAILQAFKRLQELPAYG